MIGLDTNILVRFLVEDDEAQTESVVRLLRRTSEADEALFVPDIVLVETVWVLDRSYRIPRGEIVKTLRMLVTVRHLRFEDPDRIARATDAFEHGKGGFADYLIQQVAFQHGCEDVATFDRHLLGERGFRKP